MKIDRNDNNDSIIDNNSNTLKGWIQDFYSLHSDRDFFGVESY